MKPYFIYNNVNSRDMGISILKLPPRIKPERRGEIITIPGRDGFLFESEDAYNGKNIELECTFLPPDNLSQNDIDALIMEILVWLDGSGSMIFSDYPNYYYDAKIINSIPIERLFKRYRRFLLSVELQPYSKSIETFSFKKSTTSEQNISVTSFFETPPVIYLEATGNIEIHINESIIQLDDLTTPIIIDCEMMNVVDGLGTNMNNHMAGDFPKLKPGTNTISVICEEDSTFTTMEVEYRSLWL